MSMWRPLEIDEFLSEILSSEAELEVNVEDGSKRRIHLPKQSKDIVQTSMLTQKQRHIHRIYAENC